MWSVKVCNRFALIRTPKIDAEVVRSRSQQVAVCVELEAIYATFMAQKLGLELHAIDKRLKSLKISDRRHILIALAVSQNFDDIHGDRGSATLTALFYEQTSNFISIIRSNTQLRKLYFCLFTDAKRDIR